MLIGSKKNVSCIERLGDIQVEPAVYVREKLAEYQGISSSEITYANKMTNVQACDLIKDAGRYFNFRVFLHESTFSKTNSFFTVSQCIKLIRLQLGEYNFLLV